MSRRVEEIEVRVNLSMVARCRGKIVARRKGHNIFLNTGREWLSNVISYSSFSPLTASENNRIRYMGFGIGGNRQTSLGVANAAPLVSLYPGTNVQNDTTATVTGLERPVRISGATDGPPYADGSNVWLLQIQAPPEKPTVNQTVFRAVVTDTMISYDTMLSVPLSEIGLFTNAANPALYNNVPICYDTFDTLSKTVSVDGLEVEWTLRT